MKITDWKAPVAVGALLRVLAWAAGLGSAGWVQTDSSQYWGLSSDGLAGYSVRSGFLYEWGLMRPPGYPALLALMRMITDTDVGVALLQVGFGVAAVALTYFLARRIATPSVAALAAWWLALSPIHVVDSSVILPEIPFSVFLLVGILLVAPIVEGDAVSPWRWAGSGFVLGLATLIRPIALYLPVAVVAALLLPRMRGRRLLSALLFVVAFAIPVASWIARNHAVNGVVTFSTIQGMNLAYYRAAGAIAAEERISIDEARHRIEAQVQAESFRGMNLGELAQIQSRVGMREIARHPVGYANSAVRGLAYMLLGPAQSVFVERLQATPAKFLTKPLIAVSAASALLLTLGSAIGVLVWARARAWRQLVLVGVPLGYLLVVGAGHEAWARFRVPIEPLLAILAAVGILGVREAILSRRRGAGQTAG